jgi:beta-N-acetylhexosaminidase
VRVDREQASALAGQMMVVGFPGKTLDPETAGHLRALRPAGVILFARNYESPAQLGALVDACVEAVGDDQLLVAVDQEGGRVQRFTAPFTIFPPLRLIGATGNDYLAHEVGKALGLELLAAGVNFDLAPVLDVDSNPKNPVIGDRSFGTDPHLVARMGTQMIAGLQDAGVLACGKHFPGHGDTSEDSHLKLPFLPHGLDRLQELELVPFAAAVDAEVDAIMTAHVVMRGIDPENPATLSPDVLTGLLKTRLGFNGVVVTDDLEMKAIAENYGRVDAPLRAAKAGADILLVCHSRDLQREIRDALAAAILDGGISADRAADASWRIARLKKRVPRKRADPSFIGCEAHGALAREIRELSC